MSFLCFSRAYEVWGSPEILNKEKARRNKARQEEYERKDILEINYPFIRLLLFLAIFSLKKSLKEYQKRLLILENASFDNPTVCFIIKKLRN